MMAVSQNDDVNRLLNGVLDNIQQYLDKQNAHIESLYRIGTALSSETRLDHLLEMILQEAMAFSNADGGTLYVTSDDERRLRFMVVETKSLGIKMGGTGEPISWYDVSLYKPDNQPNLEMVAAVCALEGRTINIADVYETEEYNFEGTRKFDAKTGYRSKSMLVIPMRNYEDEVIGVCQLINRMDPDTGEVVPFSREDQTSLLALASQAAIAITNVQLIRDLRRLLDSFIDSIARAIDDKSPYTGGHVQKVAQLAMMLAHAVNEDRDGPYKDIHFNQDELDQIRIAGLMHDIGKITTPEYVMDKATKLQTIFDRIDTVKTRFELYIRQLERDAYQEKLEMLRKGSRIEDLDDIDRRVQEASDEARADLAFLETINFGGEFMRDEDIERVHRIAKQWVQLDGEMAPLLTPNEVENLTIRKGTLTNAERAKINHHAYMSTEMLEALPFPKKLRRVPEIAGGHHEKLNGKGYPKGLSAEQLTLEARIMALADIFEALTASDRPYKRPNTMKEAMRIIGFMVKDYELDADLVQFFYDTGLHTKYAKESLLPEQFDLDG